MTQRLEAFIGFCVVLAASIFAFTLMQFNHNFSTEFYPVKVYFSDISGITTGAEVKMSGVKIGTVKQARLDNKDYRAELILDIQNDIKLPIDSVVKIASDSLLGGASIHINAGFDEAYIEPQGELVNTQSAVNLMDIIAKAVFSAGTNNEKK